LDRLSSTTLVMVLSRSRTAASRKRAVKVHTAIKDRGATANEASRREPTLTPAPFSW
jgi:hypothetical protein